MIDIGTALSSGGLALAAASQLVRASAQPPSPGIKARAVVEALADPVFLAAPASDADAALNALIDQLGSEG
ncbi:MAG: hypothetical protein JO290_06390 [Sphingomonadaceae bacterium]|nr:hypothetical protein [Sphingomonadaceae bacterium]